MAFGPISIALIVGAVLSVIELGLTAYVADSTDTFWTRSPNVVNFMIFNSVWSLLVLAYVGLTPLYFANLFHRLVSMSLLVVTAIFWFAGSIAMAVWLGVPKCHSSVCGAAQAAVAFGFFIWVIFTGLAVLEVLEVLRSRGHSTGSHHMHSQKHSTTYPGV